MIYKEKPQRTIVNSACDMYLPPKTGIPISVPMNVEAATKHTGF